ncbi:MAG: CvpA family protein [Planctomycetaceae bacterium]|nr:CvpA family protein [Planctomycetaceae bacterium]
MWFDAIVAVILLFTTIRGAAKGIVWQLAAIGSLVLCFFFAQSGSLAISPMIPLEPPLNRWTAMFIIYLITSLVAFGTARALREAIEKAKFVEFDRHLGAVLGFVKGAIICIVATFFAVTMTDRIRPVVMNSYSGHYSAVLLDRLAPVLPRELHDIIDPYLRKFDDASGTQFGHHHNDGDGPHFDDPADPRDSRRPGESPFDDPFSRPSDLDRRPVREDAYGRDDRVPPPQDFDPLPDERPRRDDRTSRDDRPRRDGGFDSDFPRNPPPRDRGLDRDSDPFPPARDTLPRSTEPFDAPRPSSGRDRRGAAADRSDAEILGDLASRMAGGLDPDLKDHVLDALKNTAAEHRGELVDKLGRALPGVIRGVAEEWRNGKPSDPIDRSERQSLLKEISAIYTDKPSEQDAHRSETERSFRGVPDDVVLAVLKDWHYDAYALERDEDPDPSTTVNTSLDVRILKQLKAARVPLSSLDESLQSRMQSAQRR